MTPDQSIHLTSSQTSPWVFPTKHSETRETDCYFIINWSALHLGRSIGNIELLLAPETFVSKTPISILEENYGSFWSQGREKNHL